MSLSKVAYIKLFPPRVTGMENKRILVEIGSNRRPVVFKPKSGRELVELKQAVVESFQDVLNTADLNDLLVQVKSEEWGGEFVDVLDSDSIPDKSIIKIRAITAEVSLAATRDAVCLLHLFS